MTTESRRYYQNAGIDKGGETLNDDQLLAREDWEELCKFAGMEKYQLGNNELAVLGFLIGLRKGGAEQNG